jgi:branched-chain amino acid transport system substrate-binding protein
MTRLGLALVLLLAACAPAATEPPAPEATKPPLQEATQPVEEVPEQPTEAAGEPIRVGINIPLSGPVGFLGQDEKLGYELALEEINAAGGVLGRPLQLFYADNQCNPTEGVSAHRQLLDLHKVVVTIGAACSSVTLAIMPIAEEAQIPNLVQSSTNPDITRRSGIGGNIWNFRLNVDDSIMATHYSKLIAEKASSVVMIAANNDWGRGAVAAYQPHFEQLGVEFLGAEYFEQGQPDYRPLLTKIKAQDPEALLLIMESRDAATLLRQMKEMGWEPRPLIFARGSVVTTEFAELIADDCSLGDGVMEATLNANGIYPEFDRKFEEKYGHPPHLSSGLAYSALYAVARAIEAAGSAEPAAIREGFTKLDYEDPIMGKVKFDEYNQNHPNMVITTMENCQVKLLQVIPTGEE